MESRNSRGAGKTSRVSWQGRPYPVGFTRALRIEGCKCDVASRTMDLSWQARSKLKAGRIHHCRRHSKGRLDCPYRGTVKEEPNRQAHGLRPVGLPETRFL